MLVILSYSKIKGYDLLDLNKLASFLEGELVCDKIDYRILAYRFTEEEAFNIFKEALEERGIKYKSYA